MKKNNTIQTQKVFCRKCRTITNHSINNTLETGQNDEENEIWVSWVYKTLQCLGCETVCLLEEYTCSEDYDYNTNTLVPTIRIYPEASYSDRDELHETYYLPTNIKNAYKETISAFNHKLTILTGIGLRTVVEAICKDKGVTKGKLIEKIEELSKLGFMTKQEAELMHLNRYIGNSATHDILKIPLEDLKTGIDIIEAILQNAYILPKKAEFLKLKREMNQ